MAISVPLFDIQKFPLHGMRTSPHAGSLGPGWASNLVNVRPFAGPYKIRDGCARVGSSPAANPGDYCMASWGGTINGTFYLISAWSVSSVGRLYSYNLTTGAWTEITASSGEFGNSRMGVTNPWSFAVARNPWTGRECLIIQDGSNNPRVYDPGSSYSSKVAINEAITPPGKNSAYVSVPSFSASFSCKDASTTTYVNSGANWTGADAGASTTENYIVLTRNTTADTNPTAQVQFSSTKDFSTIPQLILFWESTFGNPWDSIKVEISEDAVTYSTIWDPSSTTPTTYQKTTDIPGDTEGKQFWTGFSVEHLATSVRNAVAYVRFTWTGPAPSASVTINIRVIAASGKVQGQSYYALSYGNKTSGCQSRAIYPAVQQDYIRNLGGPASSLVKVVHHPSLFYNYSLTYLNTSTTDRDKGVDSLVIYRRDYGEPNNYFSYVSTVTLATYSGGWSYSSGSASSQVQTVDSTEFESKNDDVLAPDEHTRSIPIGTCMLSANGRMFIGKLTGSTVGNPAHSQIWISDANNPFRYRKFAFDEGGGTVLGVEGEYIFAFAFSSSSGFGENTVWPIGTKHVYRLSGFQTSTLSNLRMVAPYGTFHPESVAEHNGNLYFLSTENKVIRIGPNGIEDLSSLDIEDKLKDVYTLPIDAQAIFFNNCYYLSVDDAGTDSGYSPATYVYVSLPMADGVEFKWVEDKFQNGTLKALFWEKNNKSLYFIGSDKYVYRAEVPSQTTDAGTAYTATHASRMWQLDGKAGFTVSYVTTCTSQDPAGGGTTGAAAHTVTYFPTGKTATASSALTSANSMEDVISSPFTGGSGTGPFHGFGATVSSVFTLPGGSVLFDSYALVESSAVDPVVV